MTAVCLRPGRSSRGWGGWAREGRLVLFNCVCCSNTIISPCDSLIGWLRSGCEHPLASVHHSAFITGDCLCPAKPSDALMTHYRSILLCFCGLPQCIGDIYCCLEKLRKPFSRAPESVLCFYLHMETWKKWHQGTCYVDLYCYNITFRSSTPLLAYFSNKM